MIGWSRTRGGPEELAITGENGDVIDACFAASHQTLVVEFPQLIAVTAMPRARVVMPLVLKTHADAVVGECPQRLDQPIVELATPFASEKRANVQP